MFDFGTPLIDNFPFGLFFDESFAPFLVETEEEIVVVQGGVSKVRPVTVKRFIWTPKSAHIPLLLAVWDKAHTDKLYNFEIWNRKYDYVDALYRIFEEKNIEIPLEFRAYDIYILEEKLGEVNIVETLSNGRVVRDEDLGWVIIK